MAHEMLNIVLIGGMTFRKDKKYNVCLHFVATDHPIEDLPEIVMVLGIPRRIGLYQ